MAHSVRCLHLVRPAIIGAFRITVIQQAMFGGYGPRTARPRAREHRRGYVETAAVFIEAHRQAAAVLVRRPGEPGAAQAASTVAWAAFTGHGNSSQPGDGAAVIRRMLR